MSRCGLTCEGYVWEAEFCQTAVSCCPSDYLYYVRASCYGVN
jgi:hypothetical protein